MILCVLGMFKWINIEVVQDKVYICEVQAKINDAAAGSEVEEEGITVGGNVK